MVADAGLPSLFIFLHLSAPFDTIDHDILHHTNGVSSTALDLFQSFLQKPNQKPMPQPAGFGLPTDDRNNGPISGKMVRKEKTAGNKMWQKG